MFEHFDDVGAIRCAVADILVAISNGRCSDGAVKEARGLLEKAVGVIYDKKVEEIKA